MAYFRNDWLRVAKPFESPLSSLVCSLNKPLINGFLCSCFSPQYPAYPYPFYFSGCFRRIYMNDCLTKCHWHAVKCLISIFLLLIAYWLFLMYLLSLSKCDTYPQYALIKLMPSNFLYGCLRFRNVYAHFQGEVVKFEVPTQTG